MIGRAAINVPLGADEFRSHARRTTCEVRVLLLLCAAIAALASCAPDSQSGELHQESIATRPAAGELSNDSLVARIRARVADIERELPTYRQLTRDLAGYSLEGGTLDAFGVSPGGVRKVVATHYGETGRTIQTLYYGELSPGSLIYVIERREHYDRLLSGTVAHREQEEFFFADGTLLRWRDADRRSRGPAAAEARARGAEIFRMSNELMRCISRRSDTSCRLSP